jgi:outer membrane lipoprotein SlyB
MIRTNLAAILTALSFAACSTPNEHVPFGEKGNNDRTDNGRTTRTSNVCGECGVVKNIETVDRDNGVGAGAVVGGVVGGIAGGAIGNKIGDDDSKTGTIAGGVAGAAAGAYAGHKAQGYYNRDKEAYRITLRMDDGSSRTITQNENPGFSNGSRVRVEDGKVVPR